MREVPMYGPTAAGRVALVDDEDYELVMRHRWNCYEQKRRPDRRPQGPYATTSIWNGTRNRAVRMHIMVMGQKFIDHINHDGLDNQKHNLRPATNGQNMANRRKNMGCSSQFKGVSWNPRLRKWVAYISCDKKMHHLGVFASEEDAARAYDVAAVHYFGDYAELNLDDSRTMSPPPESAVLGNLRMPSSPFPGVSRNRQGTWRVNIMAKGEKHRAGPFASEVDAARAYDDMARELLGDAARLNFPPDIPAGAVLLDQRDSTAA